MGKVSALSVIIPTYNRAQFIEESVRSVLNQSIDTELELIVVDDGSTDDTENILKQKFGSNIQYFKNKPSGRPAVPRNFGIKRASHDIIAFQDSDDIWTKDKLAQQLPLMEDSNIALSYGGVTVLNNQQATQEITPSQKFASGSIFEKLLNENFISTLTVMCRKSCLQEVGLFNESQALTGVEDYELWLRIAMEHEVAYAPKILAKYRQHDTNISRVSNHTAHIRLLAVYKSLLGCAKTSRQKISIQERIYGVTAELGKNSNQYRLRSTLEKARLRQLRLFGGK